MTAATTFRMVLPVSPPVYFPFLYKPIHHKQISKTQAWYNHAVDVCVVIATQQQPGCKRGAALFKMASVKKL